MYVDPKTGRSILGLWDKEKQQWVLDMQGLVTIKTLAAAARERLEKNPESAGAFLELKSDLSEEEIAEYRNEIELNEEDDLQYEIELATLEIEARARELNKANQKS